MQRCSDAALVIAIADGEDVDDDHGDNNSGGDGDGWTTTTTGVVGGGMTTHPAGWIGWPIRAAAGAYCMRTLATGLPVVCDPKPGDNESRTNYACANVADAPHKHTHSHTHPPVASGPASGKRIPIGPKARSCGGGVARARLVYALALCT